MGHRTNITACLERGAKVKADFKGRLLSVHRRYFRTHVRLLVDTEHGTSIGAVEGHQKRGSSLVDCLAWLKILVWLHAYVR